MIKTKFVFAVSLVAMLAVGSAWAYDPADTTSTADTVATEHTVYTNQTPTSTKDEGGTAIAGVSYVNRVVNKAGAAATAAEAHAAAAGASALAAADSAAEAATSAQLASDALTGMVSKDQGSTNANKAVITDESGNIKTGKIMSGMIADKTIVNANISDDAAISTNKISGLAPVATSGSYTNLLNKPTIGNAELTIQKNETTVGTFAANATDDKTINITVPTKVSELTNDSGYATVGALNSVKNELSNGNTQAVNNLQGQIDALATVASTGLYTDLVNKPTIGTSSLTIKNGATDANIATFGANATAAVTATIPAASATVAGLAKIGVIPSGSEESASYASIWVE